VEESFVARMKPGDCFVFAGRALELVKVHEMTAYVRRATTRPRHHAALERRPHAAVEHAGRRHGAAHGRGRRPHFDSPEMQMRAPAAGSCSSLVGLPTPETLLAEMLHSREGWHLFLYPFAGRHVHIGLASLIAWRIAHATQAGTFSIAVNDYGFELLSATRWTGPRCCRSAAAAGRRRQRCAHGADCEVLGSLNASELAQRRFREIARVSGLIFQSHPNERRSSKQLQASSSLFYEVFRKYDPANRPACCRPSRSCSRRTSSRSSAWLDASWRACNANSSC
jgi:ATP-dependent Lhr-like helicase